MNVTMWLNRYNGHKGGKPTFQWFEVTPLYSDISTRHLYVMDAERGKYPVNSKDLRIQKPEGVTR